MMPKTINEAACRLAKRSNVVATVRRLAAPAMKAAELSVERITPKQERFVLAYIVTGNASKAYREAYDTTGMKPATVHHSAHALLVDPKITARLDALMAPNTAGSQAGLAAQTAPASNEEPRC
jgi:hypothetical protein